MNLACRFTPLIPARDELIAIFDLIGIWVSSWNWRGFQLETLVEWPEERVDCFVILLMSRCGVFLFVTSGHSTNTRLVMLSGSDDLSVDVEGSECVERGVWFLYVRYRITGGSCCVISDMGLVGWVVWGLFAHFSCFWEGNYRTCTGSQALLLVLSLVTGQKVFR